MEYSEVELEFLRSEAAKCRRCRAGHPVECDGFRVVYDERASEFYGQVKISYVPCERYRKLKHRAAKERAIRRSGLPDKWITERCPQLPELLLDLQTCVVSPQELNPKHSVVVSHIIQAAVVRHLEQGNRARYVACSTIDFDDLQRVGDILRGDMMVALDRWDGGSHHEAIVRTLCAEVEARLNRGALTVIGLLRPLRLLEARVEDEVPLIGLLESLPSVEL